jgi:hypothetical protein
MEAVLELPTEGVGDSSVFEAMQPGCDDRGRTVGFLFPNGDGTYDFHMTEDLCPAIPHSIYDIDQRYVGTWNTGGTWLCRAASQVGEWCVTWDEEYAERMIVGEIVWDGASRIQITGWWESRILRDGPRGAICRWRRHQSSDEQAGSTPDTSGQR